jgi:adenylate kinase
MAAITRLARSSSSISYLRRCLSSAISSETNPLFTIRKDPKDRNVQWVFLGCPGVGKGTYASRLCKLLGVPHIATGDLVREELASSGPLSQQVILSRSLIYLLELVLLWILITTRMILL